MKVVLVIRALLVCATVAFLVVLFFGDPFAHKIG